MLDAYKLVADIERAPVADTFVDTYYWSVPTATVGPTPSGSSDANDAQRFSGGCAVRGGAAR